jgi:hypothetical protein
MATDGILQLKIHITTPNPCTTQKYLRLSTHMVDLPCLEDCVNIDSKKLFGFILQP